MKQHSSPISPPPFMVGMAEVEVDTETGSVDVLDYAVHMENWDMLFQREKLQPRH